MIIATSEQECYVDQIDDFLQAFLQGGSLGPPRPRYRQAVALATFQDSREFWDCFQFLKPPPAVPNCDMYLFRAGVKPLWQDEANQGGGCFKIKIDKKKSNKLWQNAVFTMISPKNKYSDLMNGIRIKVREFFDEIEIWMNSEAADRERLQGLKAVLKQNLQLTDDRTYNFLPFAKK